MKPRTRGKKKMPFRHRSARHFFCRFWWLRGFQTGFNDLFGQVATWHKFLRRKLTAFSQPTKYRFATCFGMAQQPSADGHLGIPRNSYQVPWFGCPSKSVLGCFVKSFPNVGLAANNKWERKNTKDSAAQPTAQLKPTTTCIWKQTARPSASKDGTN